MTAASIRSLKAYAPKSQEADYDQAVQRAVRWLETAQPASTEDLVFKILGLIWGGGSQAAIRATAQAIAGTAAVRWRLGTDPGAGFRCVCDRPGAGGVAGGGAFRRSAAYQRGVRYLLNSQMEDGSWLVDSRRRRSSPTSTAIFRTVTINSSRLRRATGRPWRCARRQCGEPVIVLRILDMTRRDLLKLATSVVAGPPSVRRNQPDNYRSLFPRWAAPSGTGTRLSGTRRSGDSPRSNCAASRIRWICRNAPSSPAPA